MIAIIDYDAGNLKSVEKAIVHEGGNPVVTRDSETILSAEKVILPGVGSFGDAMEKLRLYNLQEPICRVVEKGTPFLGICLGLQLLFEYSEESAGVKGLSLIKGGILRIPEGDGRKVPHIGWNSLSCKKDSVLLKNLPENPYVYFVHSYYLQARNPQIISATTEYGVTIHAAVEQDNLFACQFHPEKSGEIGLQILKNFISL